MRYCKKCTMPDTRPGITFDAEGVCSACRHYEARIGEVYAMLEEGSRKAREAAAATLDDVREAMKINYFDDKELIAAQTQAFAEKIKNQE